MPAPKVRRRNGIREVASAAGVSIGTVSNVLNNPALVAGATRERVERAIRDLGFIRNAWARQLREGQGSVVGAIVFDLANPFFAEVARGIEDRLAEDNCVLILCSTDRSADREARYLNVLQEQGVRGMLVAPTRQIPDRLLEIQQLGTPVVLLDCPSPTPRLCSVSVDDVKGGELAAGHLVALGHRRIVFFNGPWEVPQCAGRSRGARRALESAGLEPARHLLEVLLFTGNAADVDSAVERVLALPERPTAIMCGSDAVALGVMRNLRHRQVKVPADIAVVGYDDLPFAAELYTPLTSVRQPTYALGRVAADLLMSEERSDHEHEQIVFEPELIIRGSTLPGGRD